ncbi:hypothetical protein C0J52_28238 [Blattella germanica]|nr:hypothetical protein C0J52_28238 [Blattella germanica]
MKFHIFTHFMVEAVYSESYYRVSLCLVAAGPLSVHHGVRCEEVAVDNMQHLRMG